MVKKESMAEWIVRTFYHGELIELGVNYFRTSDSKKPHDNKTIKVYGRRFWMLFLYALSILMSGICVMQYSVITHIMTCYYDIAPSTVSWTAVIFMIVYVVLVFPSSWLIDRVGLRRTVLLGSSLNVLSSLIQHFSMYEGGFTIVMVSQTISAVGQVLLLNVTPRVPAVWFGLNEVCRATAVGVVAYQVGLSVGFLVPSLLMPVDCSDMWFIYSQRILFAEVLIGINMLIFLLTIITFQKCPMIPPSEAEAAKVDTVQDYPKSIGVLFKNKNFLLLCISYGLSYASAVAQTTLLDQLTVYFFPEHVDKVGWMGVAYLGAGLIGSALCGSVLDYTKMFRESAIVACVGTMLSVAALSFLLYLRMAWIGVVSLVLLGLTVVGYTTVALEFGAEVTYPESESTSASLLNASQSLFSIPIIMGSSKLMEQFGPLATGICFTSSAALGCVLVFFVKCDFKRQNGNSACCDTNAMKSQGALSTA